MTGKFGCATAAHANLSHDYPVGGKGPTALANLTHDYPVGGKGPHIIGRTDTLGRGAVAADRPGWNHDYPVG
ncbi:hypothetical protein H4R35_007635, partial [Dimargaris xerosporica]